jgi:hypothetical protein
MASEDIFKLITTPYEGELTFDTGIFLLHVVWIADEYTTDCQHIWTFSKEALARNWCIYKPNFAVDARYIPSGLTYWYVIQRSGIDGSGGNFIPFAYYINGKEVEREELPKPVYSEMDKEGTELNEETLFAWIRDRIETKTNGYIQGLANCGKTYTLRKLFNELEANSVEIGVEIYFASAPPSAGAMELMECFLSAKCYRTHHRYLNSPPEKPAASKSKLRQQTLKFLKGTRLLFVIDNAQRLNKGALEELDYLIEQTENPVILVGRPGLKETLKQADLWFEIRHHFEFPPMYYV